MNSHTQAKTLTVPNGTMSDGELDAGMVNTHPQRDPVVEALRILARRGQQVLEEEAAARAAEEEATV